LTTTSSTSSTTSAYTSTTSTISDDDCPLDIIYGTHAEETNFLRQFRDNVLSQTPEGCELIKLYYQWSPAIITVMEEDKDFKNLLQKNIEAVLPMLRSIED
jgi:hypothetical protein